ncbi:transcription factor bHLH140-like protein, putative [Medicago truncatula]|uniref:Transcription factor bHLH140-like protein, putative n=1 Tax=Medicago truncatula TaxID=3880 RepID=G7LC84_MEDTR|nr:transcription factor bHLH140-like protein, putative [Medicago truncatula]
MHLLPPMLKRLKPDGGGVNASIFDAAGPELESATKEKAKTLSPGNAVVVPLPSSSPFFTREGVTHVIHVLGLNKILKDSDYVTPQVI